jgi:hypothetical protein
VFDEGLISTKFVLSFDYVHTTLAIPNPVRSWKSSRVRR